jgi:hypothetical protein
MGKNLGDFVSEYYQLNPLKIVPGAGLEPARPYERGILNPIQPIADEYNLLCADIYRLRSDFDLANEEYKKVQNANFKNIVKRCKQRCLEQKAPLMALN